DKVLDKLTALVAAVRPARPTAPVKSAAPAPGLVGLQQIRLLWETARKKANADLQRLRQAILDDFQGAPEFAEPAQASAELGGALTAFDSGLSDVLDRALNADDPQQRQKLHQNAATLTAGYRAKLTANKLLRELDANPFVRVVIYKTLADTLAL